MSDSPEVVPVPVVAEPVAPVAPVEPTADVDLGAYRKGKDAPAVEPVADTAVVEDGAAEVDPASEAGKTLAGKKGSLQSRIDELTRRNKQIEAKAADDLAATRAELAALKAGRPALSEPTKIGAEPVLPVVVDPGDPEPDPAKFDDYDTLNTARARWAARQEIKAETARQTAEHNSRSMTERQATVQAAGQAAHEDFDDAVASFVANGGTYHPAAAAVILHEPQGAEVAYLLAKDPTLNAKIAASPNPMLEIGRIMATLEAAAKPAPKPKPAPVSNAPAPMVPVVGDATAGVFDPATSNSLAEYRKNRASIADR